MPEIKPIKPTETDKDTNRDRVGPIGLLVIGTVWCLICIFPLANVLENITNEDYMLFIFAMFGLVLPIGFLLFSIGWLWYAAKTKRWRASFGWWLFSIGAWFEILHIRFFAPHNNRYWCYDSHGEQWCEPNHHFLALYFIIPAIVMIFGLLLVYLGKKQKNQNP